MRTLSTLFFFSSRRRHTSWPRDWSSDVCSSDLLLLREPAHGEGGSGPCSLADLNDLPAAGQSVREGDGQGLGSCRVRGGHRLQMQVRFGAVARVATAADHLPGSDLLVDANRGAGVLEVAQGHEDIVATVG